MLRAARPKGKKTQVNVFFAENKPQRVSSHPTPSQCQALPFPQIPDSIQDSIPEIKAISCTDQTQISRAPGEEHLGLGEGKGKRKIDKGRNKGQRMKEV